MAKEITHQSILLLIEQLRRRIRKLEAVVAQCCLQSDESYSSHSFTTSNSGGPGSDLSTSSLSSGLGSQLTTGTGSESGGLNDGSDPVLKGRFKPG